MPEVIPREELQVAYYLANWLDGQNFGFYVSLLQIPLKLGSCSLIPTYLFFKATIP